ncbi:hypothetical protein ASG68_24600 [Rhizobium sp. Leaf453]|nr:hypothetical protein ASG42_27310 [Rhizobium sp. Leaf391]KQT06769.1 hypothetical protein ASG50_13695 [Rhizobium sp. Leaf386]KQU05943.1 hypothetical protein ASG68_24600 [Rhizobium sp. Leaf453]
MIFETLSFVDLPGTAPIVLASGEIDFPEHGFTFTMRAVTTSGRLSRQRLILNRRSITDQRFLDRVSFGLRLGDVVDPWRGVGQKQRGLLPLIIKQEP